MTNVRKIEPSEGNPVAAASLSRVSLFSPRTPRAREAPSSARQALWPSARRRPPASPACGLALHHAAFTYSRGVCGDRDGDLGKPKCTPTWRSLSAQPAGCF
jgi:hypothetical protein